MTRPLSPEDVDAFMRRLKLAIVGMAAVLGVPLLILVFVLDRRLSTFEESLRYKPPSEVSEYATDEATGYSPANPVQGQIVYVRGSNRTNYRGGDN